MNKNIIIGIIGSLLLIGVGAYGYTALKEYQAEKAKLLAKPRGAQDFKNATYMIEGKTVKLVNGTQEEPLAPGSATKLVTQYFGNEAFGDLNGDGREDAVFLVTQNSGGSGTFFYVLAALNKEEGYFGSQAILLGDRIAPQTTEIKDGVVSVNYADRAPSESFAVAPSVGKTLRLKFDQVDMQFGIIADNFEGEADPATMSLTMKKWSWVTTNYSDDSTFKPKKDNTFSLTFLPDNTFTGTTDCNTVTGKYMVSKEKISLTLNESTKKFCEGSQEDDFTKILSELASYHFTSKGELIFDLTFDSGTATFK